MTVSVAREKSPGFQESRRILTVTELAQLVQGILSESFAGGVWVEGEISEPKVYPSGHLWFDLKDGQSTVKAVMWRDDVRAVKFQPEQGLRVLCFGKVDFYAPRGEIKFVTRVIEPKGLGALQLAFEQLKEKLQKEGFFEDKRKRPLPVFPERIGIVTSPRGAAIDDMLRILDGQVEVLLYPARVQGNAAAEAIALGIRELNSIEQLDLLIVGRGGGSLEDLWAFNEELVAREIVSSRLPVISAVGHEKDVTIADLVADLRAPTPTKAAEIVLAQRCSCVDRLCALLLEPALCEMENQLEELKKRLEENTETLVEGFRESICTQAQQVRLLHEEVLKNSPYAMILQQTERIRGLHQSMDVAIARSLEQSASRFSGLTGRLHALSPLAVLGRGYSITFDHENRIVREATSVKTGDLIQTIFHRGRLTSRVESIEE